MASFYTWNGVISLVDVLKDNTIYHDYQPYKD